MNTATIELRPPRDMVFAPGCADDTIGQELPVKHDGQQIGTARITAVAYVEGFVHVTLEADDDTLRALIANSTAVDFGTP